MRRDGISMAPENLSGDWDGKKFHPRLFCGDVADDDFAGQLVDKTFHGGTPESGSYDPVEQIALCGILLRGKRSLGMETLRIQKCSEKFTGNMISP